MRGMKEVECLRYNEGGSRGRMKDRVSEANCEREERLTSR